MNDVLFKIFVMTSGYKDLNVASAALDVDYDDEESQAVDFETIDVQVDGSWSVA